MIEHLYPYYNHSYLYFKSVILHIRKKNLYINQKRYSSLHLRITVPADVLAIKIYKF